MSPPIIAIPAPPELPETTAAYPTTRRAPYCLPTYHLRHRIDDAPTASAFFDARVPVFTPLTLVALAVLFVTIPARDLAMWVDDDHARFHVWQLFTYMWAHASLAHLVTNCAALAILGSVCELMHGAWRVALVYLYAGVGGALAYGWWRATGSSDPAVGYVVGASGAIYGIGGSLASHLLLNWKETFLASVWLGFICLTAFADVVLYVLLPDPRIAYTTHGVGFVHGLAMGLLVLRNPVRRPFEQPLRAVAAVLSPALMLASAIAFFAG